MVYVSPGEIFCAAIDLRTQSPSFGRWHGTTLGGDTPRQLFLPAGFAHGFCVLGGHADVIYMTTHAYNPDDEGGLNWRDPDINIDWPIESPVINDRDAAFPFLSELSADSLPRIQFGATPTDG